MCRCRIDRSAPAIRASIGATFSTTVVRVTSTRRRILRRGAGSGADDGRAVNELGEKLEKALGKGESLSDVVAALECGHAQLWPIGDSVVVTQVRDREGGRDLHVWLAAGNLDTIRRWVPALDELAREWKCDRITADGRKGWARILPSFKRSKLGLTKEVS